MADQYSEAQWQPEPADAPEGLAVVENDDLSEEVEAVTPQNAGPGPQLTDEQDPDLMDDEVIETVVDQDEQLAERARRKARLRLGTAVSTTSLVDMARQAREEAKLAQRSLDESPLPEGRFADRELSWLAFNERVLEQAEDQTLPILERA